MNLGAPASLPAGARVRFAGEEAALPETAGFSMHVPMRKEVFHEPRLSTANYCSNCYINLYGRVHGPNARHQAERAFHEPEGRARQSPARCLSIAILRRARSDAPYRFKSRFSFLNFQLLIFLYGRCSESGMRLKQKAAREIDGLLI